MPSVAALQARAPAASTGLVRLILTTRKLHARAERRPSPKELSPLASSGRIRYRADVIEELEAGPEAFIGLLAGRNLGKTSRSRFLIRSLILAQSGMIDSETTMARLQTLEADLPERKRLLCFKIGDLRATVISDGCGEMPVGPIFAVSTPQPELASVLRRTSCGRSSSTYHALVVDTPRERILVDTGFGETSARWSQLSAAARAPPPRPDYARQHRCRCAIPRPSGPYRRSPHKAQERTPWPFRSPAWSSLTRSGTAGPAPGEPVCPKIRWPI